MVVNVIIEKSGKEYWGRIEKGEFSPVTVGESVSEVLENLKELIADYLEHGGKNDKNWKQTRISELEFALQFDLQAFFGEFGFLNISAIADLSGMNASLLRQYAKGIKHPSPTQAKKIEETIHKLAGQMRKVSLVTA